MVTCMCCVAIPRDSLSSTIVKLLHLGFFLYHADAAWISHVVCFCIYLEFHLGSGVRF